MLQYKIPQNVEREDQILSFLTFRQLGILAAGGGIAYIFYLTLSPLFYIGVWGPFVFFPSMIALCVAFININGVSFTKWVLLFFEFVTIPRKRIWNNKHLAEHQIQALIVRTPSKTKEVKKESMPNEVTKPKTLSELVQEIDMQKASYKTKSSFSPHGDTELFDDEDAMALQKIDDLSKEQKEKGSFSSIVPQQKEKTIQSDEDKPNKTVELPKNSQDILQDMQKKIATVRPNTLAQTAENPRL